MNITTQKFSRRQGEQRPCDALEAVTIERCKDEGIKLSEIIFIVISVALLLLASLMMTGCADDLDTYAASQADLADAIHQATIEVAQ